MADMIKFYKGLEASLPSVGTNGALYITTDEGAIYLGTGTGMKRLGDFVQVANVAALPEKAHENCLYYCVAENILAKWNGTEWKQVNKQPTTDELKTLLGLGSAAYTDASAYDAAGSAKAVRDYVGEIPEGYTEETIIAYINKKAEETLNSASGGSSESAASVLAALNTYKAENNAKVTANTDAITAIKDGTNVDSFADVETELEKKVDKVEGKSLVDDTEIARLAGMSDGANKVEKSDVNGNIKVDGTEVVVYTHPAEHAISEITGLQDALDGMQAAGDYATKTELSDAVKAEKERAEGVESGLRTDVDAIKADYLKASDKEALQTQIDTIMNNPDTEGVINSINEFTQYISDHGAIAEGFRTDIDKNKEDIASNVAAIEAINNVDTGVLAKAKEYADGLNTAMDTRVKVLEEIDHEAYVAADTALKTELQGEIDADVKALADGQVKTNTEAIATLSETVENNATAAGEAVSALEEKVYTKTEVDEMIAEATSWGTFGE